MVPTYLVSEHFQLQPTVSTCQNFFDRSSLRSTGARDQKKKLSQFMSFYFWLIDFLFRLQLHSIHGADGDPGILFPQNCFFDITFVFLALWSGMLQGFSMALTLNLMIGACFLAFFFSSSVLGRGRNTES
jgi:hypothetical protein